MLLAVQIAVLIAGLLVCLVGGAASVVYLYTLWLLRKGDVTPVPGIVETRAQRRVRKVREHERGTDRDTTTVLPVLTGTDP